MLLRYNRKHNSCQVIDVWFAKQNAFCMWLYKIIKAWKTIFLGFVKLKDGIPNIDELPKSKEKCFLCYKRDKLKKKLLYVKCKETLIYLLNLTLSFKGDWSWVLPI